MLVFIGVVYAYIAFGFLRYGLFFYDTIASYVPLPNRDLFIYVPISLLLPFAWWIVFLYLVARTTLLKAGAFALGSWGLVSGFAVFFQATCIDLLICPMVNEYFSSNEASFWFPLVFYPVFLRGLIPVPPFTAGEEGMVLLSFAAVLFIPVLIGVAIGGAFGYAIARWTGRGLESTWGPTRLQKAVKRRARISLKKVKTAEDLRPITGKTQWICPICSRSNGNDLGICRSCGFTPAAVRH